jgi:hypothetical protein
MRNSILTLLAVNVASAEIPFVTIGKDIAGKNVDMPLVVRNMLAPFWNAHPTPLAHLLRPLLLHPSCGIKIFFFSFCHTCRALARGSTTTPRRMIHFARLLTPATLFLTPRTTTATRKASVMPFVTAGLALARAAKASL